MTSLQDMDALSLTHGSLFSGIGGFDLAVEWAGWQNLFNCDILPFTKRVLKYYWPNAIQYDDIRKTDFTIWRGRIDVLSGGFPCQPFSLAGKRKGTDDERYLWPEMLRAIREIKPRWIVGENVFGIVNWSKGLVFEQVCADLEAEGYEVQPYILPVAGVEDAPHRRDRVWFIAHAIGDACGKRKSEPNESRQAGATNGGYDAENPVGVRCDCDIAEEKPDERQQRLAGAGGDGRIFGAAGTDPDSTDAGIEDMRESTLDFSASEITADTYGERLRSLSISQCNDAQERGDARRRALQYTCNDRRALHPTKWQDFPTQSPVCSRNDGISDRLDGITFPVWRIESIKAYGNAVSPVLVYQIFDTINQYERLSR